MKVVLAAALLPFTLLGCQPRSSEPPSLVAQAEAKMALGDRDEARSLLEAASDTSTQAMLVLSSFYVDSDPARALALLDTAAARGSARAMYAAAALRAGTPDSLRGRALVQQAAALGYGPALGHLGAVHLAAGRPDSALIWFARSALADSASAADFADASTRWSAAMQARFERTVDSVRAAPDPFVAAAVRNRVAFD